MRPLTLSLSLLLFPLSLPHFLHFSSFPLFPFPFCLFALLLLLTSPHIHTYTVCLFGSLFFMRAVRFVSSLFLVWHYWSGIKVHLTIPSLALVILSNQTLKCQCCSLTMNTSPAVPLLISHICNSTYLVLDTPYLPTFTNQFPLHKHCATNLQEEEMLCPCPLGRGHEEHWANRPKTNLRIMCLSLSRYLSHILNKFNGECHQCKQRYTEQRHKQLNLVFVW